MIKGASRNVAGAVPVNKHDAWKSALDTFTLEEVLRGGNSERKLVGSLTLPVMLRLSRTEI